MEKKLQKCLNLFSILALILIFSSSSKAVIHEVSVNNFSFSPGSINNVIVGDTIRWEWGSGDHTTTSVSIPSGATAWDSPISSTQTVFDYVVTEAGSYTYKCTPHSGSMSGAFTAGVQTGINFIKTSPASAIIYPNPFINSFYINLRDMDCNKAAITDILGKKIVEIEIQNRITSISENNYPEIGKLPAGMYFITLTGSDKSKYTAQIIKSEK